MKKRLLVMLSGISNSGKSTTLKNLLGLLLKEKYVKLEQDINIPSRGDIGPLVIEFEDKEGRKLKVGFSSAGDNEEIVKNNLIFFENHKCEIAFCATKSSGLTVKCIEEHIDKYNEVLLLPFYKVWRKDKIKGQQYACELAQEMLLQTKLRWNKLVEIEDVFRFD